MTCGNKSELWLIAAFFMHCSKRNRAPVCAGTLACVLWRRNTPANFVLLGRAQEAQQLESVSPLGWRIRDLPQLDRSAVENIAAT